MKVKDLKKVFIEGHSGSRAIKFDIVSDWPDAPSELKDYSDECEVVDARCGWTFSGIVITIRISYMDSVDDIIKGIDNKIVELQAKKVEVERAFYRPSE
jgi:hypothetical protein